MEIKKVIVSKTDKKLNGHITLEGSKSISNRVLVIQALCSDDFIISGISPSDDTQVLQTALTEHQDEYYLGHAGTSYRFLTAYHSFTEGTQVLKGSSRMHQRPIGPLVDALREIGADIEYLEKEGYPPLKINAPSAELKSELTIEAGISSQFITALCLLAPTLPAGLTIHLDGEIVSVSYIKMTLSLMQYFGIEHSWDGHKITIAHQKYTAKDIHIEADWSAASYYYILAAIADEVDLQIGGLTQESMQGDAEILKIGEKLGILSTFNDGILTLSKSHENPAPFFENDFLTHPDIAQSVAVMCISTGIQGLYTGLQTLKIKETDRIAALKAELSKVGGIFYGLPAKKFAKGSGKEYYMVEGKAAISDGVQIETYNDHRMAMCFAPLGMLHPITILDPDVVSKSYPSYWDDLESLGFKLIRN